MKNLSDNFLTSLCQSKFTLSFFEQIAMGDDRNH